MAQNDFFSHTGSDGSSAATRISMTGFGGYAWGEVIQAGSRSATQVVSSWMASPPHCQILMMPEFTRVGGGCSYGAQTQYQFYWTANFM